MPLKTSPLNNNVLIEIVREYEGVSRIDDAEVLKTGIVCDYSIVRYHLTASAALALDDLTYAAVYATVNDLVGKTVRWEQYAEGGQTFEEDGKTYALVPFWRLISVTEEE